MSDSVKKMLEKKEFIDKNGYLFFHHFETTKFILTFAGVALSPFIVFIIAEIMNGSVKFHETGLGQFVIICCMITVLGSFILSVMFMLDPAKIIKNKESYLKECFSDNDRVILFSLFPELEGADISDFKKVLKEEREKINSAFNERENLKEMHELMIKNEVIKEKFFDYFKEKVKEYNKKELNKKNDHDYMNKELDKIGFSNFNVPNNKLSLSIEEE